MTLSTPTVHPGMKGTAASDKSERRETRGDLPPSASVEEVGGGKSLSKTDNGPGPGVTPDKVPGTGAADATGSKTHEVAKANHEHIYALREIVKPSVNVRRDEEEYVKECAPPPIQSPRIITSKVVRASCGVYKKLEETTAGTVLCEGGSSHERRTGGDETISGNYLDSGGSFGSSDSRAPLAIAAVPFSSVRRQLECPEATSSNGCDRLTSMSQDWKPEAKKKKRKRVLRLLSNLIPLKHLESRSSKNRNRRRKSVAQPVMVITDGGIDWSRSSCLLDGLDKSSKLRIIVRESRTSPDSFDGDEQIVVQDVADPPNGGLIYKDSVVMNNSLSPSESFYDYFHLLRTNITLDISQMQSRRNSNCFTLAGDLYLRIRTHPCGLQPHNFCFGDMRGLAWGVELLHICQTDIGMQRKWSVGVRGCKTCHDSVLDHKSSFT